MSTPQLVELLNNQLNIQLTKLLADQAAQDPLLVQQLVDLSKTALYPTNWRAAWVLDHLQQTHKQIIDPFLTTFLNDLWNLKSDSVKRHYVKMLSQGNDEILDDGRLVDFCFERLMSQLTPIAMRAYCMEILRRLAKKYPELANELTPVLHEIIANGSKGEKNKASKVLKEIGVSGW